LVLAVAGQSAMGATLTWDPSSHPATGSDASGNWNTATTNWSNGSSDVAWINGSIAGFGAGGSGTPTVTLTANMNVSGLTFNAPGPGYQLSGFTLNFASGSVVKCQYAATINSNMSMGGPLTFNTSAALTVNGTLSGANGFTTIGNGSLILNGDNTFTGNINLSTGTVTATLGDNGDNRDSGLGSWNGSGRAITVGSGAMLLLTGPGGADTFGNGIAGQNPDHSGGSNPPDPNLPTITIDGGTLSSTNYTAIGNLVLNGGTLTQDCSYVGTESSGNFYQGYQFIDSITVGGTSPSTISATAYNVSGPIGGNHLGPDTSFMVAKTSSVAGTVDLVVSSPLLDESEDFAIYPDSGPTIYLPGALTKTGSGTMSLTAANSYTGGTNVSAGTLIFAAPGALPIDTQLIISAGATAMAAQHGSGAKNALFASSLTIAGSTNAWTGKLDLSDNDLDVQNGNLAQLSNQLKSGFNSGTWNGSAGITSSAAYGDTRHLTALGIIQNSTNGLPTGTAMYGSFDGQPVTAADVLIKYTYYGDANLDGSVTSADYTRIDAGYLSHGTLSGWANGDFNYDGVVNGSDYTLIDNAFNMQGATIAAAIATTQIAPESSSVPEPGSVGLGLIGVWSLRRRRTKSRSPA
jgi:autotransporter-associated beta strand protein